MKIKRETKQDLMNLKEMNFPVYLRNGASFLLLSSGSGPIFEKVSLRIISLEPFIWKDLSFYLL